MTSSRFLTVREVADRLRRSTKFVERELRAKNLRGANIGGWRVAEADLESYIEAHMNVRPVRKPAA